MTRLKLATLFSLASIFIFFVAWDVRLGATNQPGPGGSAQNGNDESGDPDVQAKGFLWNMVDKESYITARDQYIGLLRGIEPGSAFDASVRAKAIEQLQRQEDAVRIASDLGQLRADDVVNTPGVPTWIPIGPFTIPNGQLQTGTVGPASGRITVVISEPTNPNTIYIGTAQGGVWRSVDGGNTWVSIFDNAQSLAIGALALAPSNKSILYIGTGEPNLCADCFFGVGLYRIDNADTTSGDVSDLKGPINPPFSYVSSAAGNPTINTTTFGGRSISQIVVHPTDPATIFVSTSTGASGSGANSLGQTNIPPTALVGLYRSTNGTAAPAAVTFQKLTVATDPALSNDVPPTGNIRVSDIIMEPGEPNNLLASTFGNPSATSGGIFRSTNALAPSPTFTNTLVASANRIRFAIQKTGATVTVLAATSEVATTPGKTGQLRRSVDGGATWPNTPSLTATTGGIIVSADGFCGGQCFYNVTVAMAPNDPTNIYLGGNARSSSNPNQDSMKKSSDGITFTRDDNNIHADSHGLFVTSTTPPIVFTGNDGGIWKRDATQPAGSAWTNLNKAPLNTMQFVGLGVHPVDQNFTIGGTQDNGTEAQRVAPGNWISAEGGDGGYARIDQSATDTDLNLKAMYHTFFNQKGNQIGFDRTFFGRCLDSKDSWEFRGSYSGQGAGDPTASCDGTAFDQPNGINLNDDVLFYAPMALGPGSPNTVYFGTDKLYRSADRGDTMVAVSQLFAATIPVSTIGISRQDDNVRIVGLRNGKVFATFTGANPMVDTAFPVPANATGSTTNRFIGRAVVDPNNKTIGYVTLSYYTANSADAHVWKVTNLDTAPAWTALPGTGANTIPNIPVNAFAIDPTQSLRLFAGTDIGVYVSQDGGANWVPMGQGLPRVAVFDMAVQPSKNILRVATHGRGMWEIPTSAAATPTIATQVAPSTATTGTPVSDNAGLAGGISPTGTITFKAYGPNNSTCTGAAVFTSTVTVNGNGGYNSGPFTPTAAGTYNFVASYSGDNNNNAVTTNCGDPSETVVVSTAPTPTPTPTPVQKVSPTLTTQASATTTLGNSISDTATLSGGNSPTGNITFRLYGPNDTTCGGAVIYSSTVAVNGNGNYSSGSFTPTSAGTYRWIATYSGDAANNTVATACNDTGETSGVSPTPTPTPTATPTATPMASPTPTPTPTPPAQAQNLSTRAFVGTGDNQEIGGFIITGGAKRVIVRGIGPALTKAGVAGALADPVLELHRGDGFLLVRNNNWRDSQEAEIAASGLAPTFDVESAIIITLPAGNYTAILSGNNGGTGIGLVEVYDLDPSPAISKLGNLSTRGFVQTGDRVMIGGVILGRNAGSENVIVRGLGPSLAAFGVSNTLSDPTLELRNADGTLIKSNDNWQDDPAQAATITAAGLAPTDPNESAIAASLAPGNYTAILAGRNSGTGIGLVEFYFQ